MTASALRHPLLDGRGIPHGFGVRGADAPVGLSRPRQVHGAAVAHATAAAGVEGLDADAVVSREPGLPVGIVTADCVPVLAASADGGAVAAIHAGWRGLAAGVIEQGVHALRAQAPAGARVIAVLGPHIGACCYEVDEPVLLALRARFGGVVEGATRPSRPGHCTLDLALLALEALDRSGLAPPDRSVLPNACTFCDAVRFHSHRRDGDRAGRLLHHVSALPAT